MRRRLGMATLLLLIGTAAPLRADDVGTGSSEPLLSNTRQLVREGLRSGEGYFSSDGRFLVFQSEREPENPFYQIYRMNLATEEVNRISTGVGKTTCAWPHPAGDRVLFASTHHFPEARAEQQAVLTERVAGTARSYTWKFDHHYELYSAKNDGSGMIRLTDSPGYDAEGSYSPDGSQILFASNRHAHLETLSPEAQERFEKEPNWAMELYLMDADGSNVRRLTHEPGYDGGPFFSADGGRIVWRRFADVGRTAEIFVMDADGSRQRAITRLGALSWAPFFHPSGEYVIFTTSLHGHRNFELYLVDSEGHRDPIRVTDSDGFDGLPAFSPDGQTLAWSSSRGPDAKPQIFLSTWNHTAARQALGLPPNP